jgi:hypothetical protein
MTDPTQLEDWMTTQRARDVFHGYTPHEIESMPPAQYARLRELAGFPAIEPQPDTPAPQEPAGTVTETQGMHGAYTEDAPDFRSMSMQQYAEFRAAAGIGRSASMQGIFGN